MQSFHLVLISISLLATAVQASPNPGPDRPLNNPVYSSNNYKQPHFASTFHEGQSVLVKTVLIGTTHWANYKHQMPATEQAEGVVAASTTTHDLAGRNYKMQHINDWQPVQSDRDYPAKKHHKHHHSLVGHS